MSEPLWSDERIGNAAAKEAMTGRHGKTLTAIILLVEMRDDYEAEIARLQGMISILQQGLEEQRAFQESSEYAEAYGENL